MNISEALTKCKEKLKSVLPKENPFKKIDWKKFGLKKIDFKKIDFKKLLQNANPKNIKFKDMFKDMKLEKPDFKNLPRKYVITMAVLAVAFVFILVNLISILYGYHTARKFYEEANAGFVSKTVVTREEQIVKPEDRMPKEEELSADVSGFEAVSEEPEPIWYERVTVDLEGIQAINPEVKGWIYFEKVQISYPVLFSGDNIKYMTQTYDGRTLKAGSIFMDENNTPDFTDKHTIIYGHNMRDLSMFGRLKYYKSDREYYDGREYFQIFTNDKIYRYQIFAYKDIAEDSDLYFAYNNDNINPADFAKNVLSAGSYVNGDVTIGADDKIITLSTCTADETKRFIVSAVRVDEHDR